MIMFGNGNGNNNSSSSGGSSLSKQDTEAQFKKLLNRYLESRDHAQINWDSLEPPREDDVVDYANLRSPKPDRVREMLNKLVIVKLNGGLGTSMGCTGPKSVIQLRNDLTLLDLAVRQVEKLNQLYNCDVPLVLMNSFNTHEDTLRGIKKYEGRKCTIHTFLQSKFPRINKETLMPEPGEFYSPGQGDFYETFYNSNLLNMFIEQEREYCFVSNIDNLGAGVDLPILNELISKGKDAPTFVMEVTDKTMADAKGGTLVERHATCNGHKGPRSSKLMLLEIAQVPEEHVDEFKGVKKFKIFNTNNLWMRLSSIKSLVESQTLELDIIVNPKHLDGGIDVIQLETAVGAAIKYFERAIGINVPRSRFLPVKETSDLLLIKSKVDQGANQETNRKQFQSDMCEHETDAKQILLASLAEFQEVDVGNGWIEISRCKTQPATDNIPCDLNEAPRPEFGAGDHKYQTTLADTWSSIFSNNYTWKTNGCLSSSQIASPEDNDRDWCDESDADSLNQSFSNKSSGEPAREECSTLRMVIFLSYQLILMLTMAVLSSIAIFVASVWYAEMTTSLREGANASDLDESVCLRRAYSELAELTRQLFRCSNRDAIG